MNTQQILATIIAFGASVAPAFADINQYPSPPQSLLMAPSVKGGELTDLQSLYPAPQKSFWGDDAISKQFAQVSNQLSPVSKQAMQLVNGNAQSTAQPKIDPQQARYLYLKELFEKRARALNDEQSKQYRPNQSSEINGFYRWRMP